MSADAESWTSMESPSSNPSNSLVWNGYRYAAIDNRRTIGTMTPLEIVKVTVDGKPVVFDVAPVVIEGRNLVPVRTILNAFGADVKWDGTTQSITITSKQFYTI